MSLINRMRNRVITAEELKKLGVDNPYTDLVETYWAYGDLLEATIKHSAADWHKLHFSDTVNRVTERFVDENGREIAEPMTTNGAENHAHKDIKNFRYMGYVTTITYVYKRGAARLTAEKSVDKPAAKVGDKLVYRVTVGNENGATDSLKNVTMTDDLPAFVDFIHGSVQVDGVTAQHSFDNAKRRISVSLDDIKPGQKKEVTFSVTVNDTAYGQKFSNTATLSADNAPELPATDGGVTVADGAARLIASKSVDKTNAKVGDTITYTVTATNAETATTNLKNVVLHDTLSEHLTFDQGSAQVDGFAARNFYDNATRQLTVELGNIAPGQTKTVTFTCKINSSAYGESIQNAAVLSADNDEDKPAESENVAVEPGAAEGSAGAKTVEKPAAKVGETLTYTISLRNAASATADWTDVKVVDKMPDFLSFTEGGVEENGRATTNFTFDSQTKTLTLLADSIAPGEDRIFTFRAVVEDGAQGKYIVNTALVQSPDRADLPIPDAGVQIDAGAAVPQMSKSASVTEARPGDIFRYTIRVKNGEEATADWKNVIVSDVLPTGVKLVAGSVALNGETVSYGVSGQAIEVTAGNLRPGQDAAVTFEARVLDGAEGTTIENAATAKGDNGEKSATDDGVTVPLPDETGADTHSVTGTKNVDRTVVNAGEKVTYTVTAANNSEETWTAVQVYDLLDTSALTLIDDSVMVDGVRFLSGSGKWTFTDRQLVFNLGDIPAGKSVICEFTVKFKNDAANSTYVNHATLTSTSHENVYLKAPEVAVMAGSGDKFETFSDLHYRLFIGNALSDGTPLHIWDPDTKVTMYSLCAVGYRLMTDYYRTTKGDGTLSVPSTIIDREAQFFISHGVLRPDEYPSWDTLATQEQVYRVLSFALGKNLTSGSQANMARHAFASLICRETNRDTASNTNGLTLAHFTDKGPYGGLIDEVSNSHDYTLDSSGHETWISILD